MHNVIRKGQIYTQIPTGYGVASIEKFQKKYSKKDIEKLREEVSENVPKKNINHETPYIDKLNPDLIKKLQQEAIEGYEIIRKERKEKKKQLEAQKQRDLRNMNTINNALNPPQYGQSEFFSHLF